MEPLMQGWLTKSPPEKKTQGPWKLFKAKWRRRFFVLLEIPAAEALPGQRAALVYFDSENRKHKLGGIDLSSCDEVQQRLESSFYQYVFSLRSKHKGKDRTYYLVADNEYEMNKWVDHLCCVLGLKETEGERQVQSMPTLSPVSRVRAVKESDTHDNLCHSIEKEGEHAVSNQGLFKERKEHEPYILLDECWTGNERPFDNNFTASLNQVPPAPAEYVSHGQRQKNRERTGHLGFLSQPPHQRSLQTAEPPIIIQKPDNNICNTEMYDKPRSYLNQIETGGRNSSEEITCNKEWSFESSYEKDGQSLYDIPKHTIDGRLSSLTDRHTDDYDIPPPRFIVPHLREDASIEPPGVEHSEQRYMNLPTSSKSHPKSSISTASHSGGTNLLKLTRDISPNAMTSEYLNVKLLEFAPPPPVPHLGKNHRYVNAKSEHVEPAKGPIPEMWDKQVDYKLTKQNVSLDMLVTKAHSTRTADVETERKVEQPVKSTEKNDGKIGKNQYDGRRLPLASKDDKGDAIAEKTTQSLLLFPNHRTRSFKRNICSPSVVDVPLPLRKEGTSSGSSSNEDTDDIDEEDSGSEVPFKAFSHVPKKSLESTPPPPKTALEIQYLDLDLHGEQIEEEDSEEGSSISTKDCSQTCGVTTDYREIDFIKTKALGIMKHDLEKKRKSSDKSSDEI